MKRKTGWYWVRWSEGGKNYMALWLAADDLGPGEWQYMCGHANQVIQTDHEPLMVSQRIEEPNWGPQIT